MKISVMSGCALLALSVAAPAGAVVSIFPPALGRPFTNPGAEPAYWPFEIDNNYVCGRPQTTGRWDTMLPLYNKTSGSVTVYQIVENVTFAGTTYPYSKAYTFSPGGAYSSATSG